jgi:hypothetical protein
VFDFEVDNALVACWAVVERVSAVTGTFRQAAFWVDNRQRESIFPTSIDSFFTGAVVEFRSSLFSFGG